eukprot:gene13436-9247_t
MKNQINIYIYKYIYIYTYIFMVLHLPLVPALQRNGTVPLDSTPCTIPFITLQESKADHRPPSINAPPTAPARLLHRHSGQGSSSPIYFRCDWRRQATPPPAARLPMRTTPPACHKGGGGSPSCRLRRHGTHGAPHLDGPALMALVDDWLDPLLTVVAHHVNDTRYNPKYFKPISSVPTRTLCCCSVGFAV